MKIIIEKNPKKSSTPSGIRIFPTRWIEKKETSKGCNGNSVLPSFYYGEKRTYIKKQLIENYGIKKQLIAFEK